MKLKDLTIIIGLGEFALAVLAYLHWMEQIHTGLIIAQGIIVILFVLTFVLKKITKKEKVINFFIAISIISLIDLPVSFRNLGNIVTMDQMMMFSLLFGVVYLIISLWEMKMSKKQSHHVL